MTNGELEAESIPMRFKHLLASDGATKIMGDGNLEQARRVDRDQPQRNKAQ